ncbi:CatB-related O-acetyltransferase [Sinorhizobium meliloti]|uniref:CatB-related O-acetyltransferase n=1 Tax=Rhizobium meliloti TaxID=382 RepID=UPI00398CF148
MGRYSYINSGFIRRAVEIGRYCSIGRNVTIGTGTHDIRGLTTSPVLPTPRNLTKYADEKRKKTVVIGHDVWIGDQVIVLNGVTIGTGAVIAAGSIVTKNVPPYAIVGGNYAKPIGPGTRFPQHICDRLLETKWWEIPLALLRETETDSPEKFLAWYEKNGHLAKREPFLSRSRKV